MSKIVNLHFRYDDVTGVYILINHEINIEITLPRKLTPEMHKLVRGK